MFSTIVQQQLHNLKSSKCQVIIDRSFENIFDILIIQNIVVEKNYKHMIVVYFVFH